MFLEKATHKAIPDDYKYLGNAHLGVENPGSDSLKAINDSLGVMNLTKRAVETHPISGSQTV